VCDGEVVEFDQPLFVISYDNALANDEDLFLFGKRKNGANSLLREEVSDVKRGTIERNYFVVEIWMFSAFEKDRIGHSAIIE